MIPWTAALQVPLSKGVLQARILEWVAIPYSLDPGIETTSLGASALVGGFFTTGAPAKPLTNN